MHLFKISIFLEEFVKLINENIKENYHEFWIYGDKSQTILYRELLSYDNVKYIHNIVNKLELDKINKFDRIFYHGVFEQDIIDVFFRNRRLLRKVYLYFWGGDKFLHGSSYERFKKKNVVRNARAVINILPEEIRFMNSNYNIKGMRYCAMYGPHTILEHCSKFKNISQETKDYIAIQIGNSSDVSNNHEFLMNKISKYKNENIKVFVPLLNGDKKYVNRIICMGKELFGDKFFAITDYMDADNYHHFLSEMDIALFGIKRQQALGNIIALLYLGKKVFLRENSIVEHYFRKMCHCNTEIVEKIDEMDFKEFATFASNQALKNEIVIFQKFQKESVVKSWNEIFNDNIYERCFYANNVR